METFIVATFIVAGSKNRMETLKLKKASGRAKLTGTLVGLGGAMLLTFYKGPEIRFLHNLARTRLSHAHGNHQLLRPPPAEGSRILGSFLAIASCFSFAIWLTIQAKVGQVYPCHYSIAAMVCLFGAVQSTLLALCMHRDTDHWRLGLNIRLYSSAYAVIDHCFLHIYVPCHDLFRIRTLDRSNGVDEPRVSWRPGPPSR
jgi:drug/metabolite transporter (DMT)-like permease